MIIDGYTNKWSYFPGEIIKVFSNCDTTSDCSFGTRKKSKCFLYSFDENILDYIEYEPIEQNVDLNKNLGTDGFGYKLSFEYKIPEFFTSGIYLFDNIIPFIIKKKNVTKNDIIILIPTNTINAYNFAGGKSLYRDMTTRKYCERLRIASFHRPTIMTKKTYYNNIIIRKKKLFQYLDGILRWFLSIKIKNCAYICDFDMDNYKYYNNSRMLMIIGHSEYWSWHAKKNLNIFVQSGKNVAILSGNTMWWQIRYNTFGKQMICYKDGSDPIKSKNYYLNTTYWYTIPSKPIMKLIGSSFRYGGFGKDSTYKVPGWDGMKIVSKSSPILNGLINKDKISFLTNEGDGCEIFVIDGKYIINNIYDSYRIELVALDKVHRLTNKYNCLIAYQEKKNSGKIINVGTTNWCSMKGIGESLLIQKITFNIMDILYNNKEIFSNNYEKKFNYWKKIFDENKNKKSLSVTNNLNNSYNIPFEPVNKCCQYIFKIYGKTNPKNILINISFLDEKGNKIIKNMRYFDKNIIYVKLDHVNKIKFFNIKIPFNNKKYLLDIENISYICK